MPQLIGSLQGVKVKTKKKARKYETHSYRWRKIRMAHLRREPLCRHCLERGVTTAGNTVDHIDNDSWNNAPDNFQTLCTSCHTIKTNTEDGGLGRAPNRGGEGG